MSFSQDLHKGSTNLLLIITITGLFSSGCGPTLINYRSTYSKPNAIPTKARLEVILRANFKKSETNSSIIQAIQKDLSENLFNLTTLGNYEIDVRVTVDRLEYISSEVSYTLLWFPLWYIGAPVGKPGGTAKITLVISHRNGSLIASYEVEKKVSHWAGLYYGWKYDVKWVTEEVLRLAMDDIKTSVVKDREEIVALIDENNKKVAQVTVQSKEARQQDMRKEEVMTQHVLYEEADVDTDIPLFENNNPDAIAVILGVEQYRSVPGVRYARRDAGMVKQYVVRVLGVPDDRNHCYVQTDEAVTKGEFEKLFSENGWLARRVQPTSDVYVYFAGHGAPETKERRAYLLPYDGDPNYPLQTGFSLDRLYEELGKLPARSVTVFLDACFSGGTRENTMLLADARPVMIEVDNLVLLSEKMVAFMSSSGNQISSSFPDKQHGLFTYFLLKGLRGDADEDGNKAVTVEELERYLVVNVKRTAGQLDREQIPQVMGSNKSRVLVQY